MGDADRLSELGTATVALSRTVLVDGAYDALMSLIMDRDLRPGTPLRIDAIARDWGVSPTPIREALAKLESTGLVVRVPHKGYAVAPMLTEEEFVELMAARLLIEPYNARTACQRDAAGTAVGLREWHARMAEAARVNDSENFRHYLKADSSFHDVIARAAGNRFLNRAIDPMAAHVQRFRRFSGSRVSDADEALAEHQAILTAFEQGDPEVAAAAMEAHLRGVAERATHTTTDG
ncbi:GntR family transcriptional regulator [Goodfellowiella coeruleoviolacea]|uniref:Transcriptional regulator, GntR family n=1 Tax=Goodfellowiella coeruleoviolacea TaxID=334858 RepID=A0AAE3KM50_9PSEU|nr:GntR family transcriptional regulator [Goodfellowiella coeruleoviolacea]MCP2167183.1 transcriptional regulator, GntR family [Goodfellowiella coeruleoviolacea]